MEVTDSSKQSELRAGLGSGACGSGLARALTLSERGGNGSFRAGGSTALVEAINLLQKGEMRQRELQRTPTQ